MRIPKLYNFVAGVRANENDVVAPYSFTRKGSDDNLQHGVVPEYYEGRLVENGAGTYNFDVLVPADSWIVFLGAYAEALWTAATSASLEVGDYTDAGVAIDADGFFTAVDLKATDLTLDQSVTLLGAGQGGVAGAYNSGTNTHWDKLYSTDARIIRFSAVSVGAGTAGRTRCVVGLIHAAEALTTVTQ